jgi:hypothetical protein
MFRKLYLLELIEIISLTNFLRPCQVQEHLKSL